MMHGLVVAGVPVKSVSRWMTISFLPSVSHSLYFVLSLSSVANREKEVRGVAIHIILTICRTSSAAFWSRRMIVCTCTC